MAELIFEEALKKLETIVEGLEQGKISLDDSLKKYEEGIKLSRFCSEKLEEAEKKIEILTKDSSGNIKKEPFKANTEDGKENTETKSREAQKSKATKSQKGKEDFLF